MLFHPPGGCGGSSAEPGSGPAWGGHGNALCFPPQLSCWELCCPPAPTPAPGRALLKTVLIPPSSTDPVRTGKLLCSQSSFPENENL